MKKLTPHKELPQDFTAKTLALSRLAQKRRDTSRAGSWFKRIVPAGAVVLAIITSSAGVYATANWFDGKVEVTTNETEGVIKVNALACQSQTPPGFEPTADKSNLQFKTMRPDHISSDDLRELVLIGCEFSETATILQSEGFSNVASSEIVAIGPDHITLAFNLGPTAFHKELALDSDVKVWSLGQRAERAHLAVGDRVVIAYEFLNPLPYVEDQNQWLRPMRLQALAKTYYDTRLAPQNSKAFYEENGIMPLPHYQSFHQ